VFVNILVLFVLATKNPKKKLWKISPKNLEL